MKFVFRRRLWLNIVAVLETLQKTVKKLLRQVKKAVKIAEVILLTTVKKHQKQARKGVSIATAADASLNKSERKFIA